MPRKNKGQEAPQDTTADMLELPGATQEQRAEATALSQLQRVQANSEQTSEDTTTSDTQTNTLLGVEQTQWRPTTNEMVMTFTAEQFQALLAHTMPSKKIDTPPPFKGEDTEDPREFLQACERYFQQAKCTDKELLKVVSDSLQGKAAQWWRPFASLPLSWVDFSERFLRRFDGPEVRASLTAQLYGQKQGPKENSEIFLLRKLQLFRRLQPSESPSTFIPVLIELLKPSIRPYLRMAIPNNTEELVTKAAYLEKDLEEHSSSLTRETKTTPREAPPPLLEPQLPKCRYCPGRHFHRDCPHLRHPEPPRPAPPARPVGPPNTTNQPAASAPSAEQPENWRRPRREEAEQRPVAGPSATH